LGTNRTPRKLLGIAVAVVAAALVASVIWPTRQRQGPSGGHPQAEAKLAMVLPEVRFENTPLRDAIDRLRGQSGVNLVVEWPPLEEEEVGPDLPIDLHLRNVTLDSALSALTAYASSRYATIDYTASGDAIVITSSDGMASHVYARLYDVRDIHNDCVEVARRAAAAHPPPPEPPPGIFGGGGADHPPTLQETDEELVWTIMSTIDPDIWRDNGGSGGQIHTMSGRILVVAAWCQHRQIEELLNQMRSPVVPRPQLASSRPTILPPVSDP